MYRLIGAASGWGAQIRACELGPDILRSSGLLDQLKEKNIPISEWETLYPKKLAKNETVPLSQTLPLIHSFNLRLAAVVENALDSEEFPIILGGDHSIAVGTWNGAYQYFKKENQLPLGLIWIDAHMDAHTPETTPSGAWHGMPLAGLLGYGDPKMAALKQEDPILRPENICLIGTRSFEEGEAALLKRLNVRIFFMDEVRKKGLFKVMQEAIAYIKEKSRVFGVSLDLDAITPEEAPGVGTPETEGIAKKDLLSALTLLPEQPDFKVFELVEYNPERNHHKKTARLCFEILSMIMQGNS